MSMPKKYDPDKVEPKWQEKWREWKIFKFDPDTDKQIFSIDTPPPYISGKLHVGHAMSYGQAEFIARFMRMKGYEVFYPMGFDDNGLPTERHVEEEYGVKSKEMERRDFIELCLNETQKLNKDYRELWNRLGMSVDWGLFYSTIDERCRRISQKSFLDLWKNDRVYRKEDPILWCPECQTALAQADLEDKEENTFLNTILFEVEGEEIEIATTRPELLPACVAVFVNPEDERWQDIVGEKAKVPLFGQEVEIKSDERVDPDFGSGIVMVCTFGDKTDIEWWREYNLDLKLIIDEGGGINEEVPEYEGLTLEEVEEAIVEDLKKERKLKEREQMSHTVNVHERCETPAEFLLKPQWFVKIMDIKDELIERGREINWYPEFMRNRYEDWIEGLKWDWCISRQRHYGVPFPVWYCEDCGEVVLAKEENLPVDPLEDEPEGECECGSKNFRPERDIFDTWMTSSVTPQINAKWGSDDSRMGELLPMSFRPQGYDIIRTWAFYTIVKGHLHHDSVPWEDIFINGMGLDEEGNQMSKSEGNVIEPENVIDKYSADALRWWSSGVKLGEDLQFKMKDVISGENFMKKLWNASRFVSMHMDDFEGGNPELKSIDRWMLHRYNSVLKKVTELFEEYKYSKSKRLAEQFFWETFCDNYLEMVKYRLYNPEDYGEESRQAALYTLYHVLLGTLKIFAPIIPHITEEIYQELFRAEEGGRSIHISNWPEVKEEFFNEEAAGVGEVAKDLVEEVRRWKSDKGIPLNENVEMMQLDTDSETREKIEEMKEVIKGTMNVEKISYERVVDSGAGIKVQNQPVEIKKIETA